MTLASVFSLERLFDAFVGGVLVLLAIWLWKDVFPRVVQRFRRDEPLLSAKWKTTFVEEGREYHETVTLVQKGRRVGGHISLRESDDEIATYRFEAMFRHLILSGTYQSTDPGNFEQGAFAIRYLPQKAFKGQYIVLSQTTGTFIAVDYAWEPCT